MENHKNLGFLSNTGPDTIKTALNATFQSLKARKVFIFQHFSFCEQLKFHAQLS